MPRRHPFERGVILQTLLVERNRAVLLGETTEALLETVAHLLQPPRHLAHAIRVRPRLRRLRLDAGVRCAGNEELLDGFGHKPAFLGLDRLAHNGREVELAPGEALKRRLGDPTEALWVDRLDDTILDFVLVRAPCVHLAQPFLEQTRREDLADDVKDLVSAELLANLAQAVEQLLQHAALAS